MTDKELQHLSRVELIEIIYELQKQNEAAAAQVKRLEKALADREIHISNAGSIAEAAMGLNGVFEAAQAAADQYLLSLQAAAAELKAGVDQAEKQRQSILQGAERQAAWIVRDAEQKAKITPRRIARWSKSGIALKGASMSLSQRIRKCKRL